ncbi:MAG TPA: bifunctional aspartate kinase/homoserine dehydrogenase I, partial [Chitinophagaceae bacterium]|nr:bifunctional aspartate kinase/homoserine dehydrogenase I [Chitinophagaceae bacterium]
MQVLKFGGSSVAHAENINKVIDIVQKATFNGRTVVVVSALSGVTDLLLQAASLAVNGSEEYKERLKLIEQKHLDAVKQLIPV